MSRLIDADELRKNVLKWMPSDPCGKEEKEFPFETDICASMVMEIDDAPTVQPDTTTHDSIPAKTGKNDGDRTSGDCISRAQAIDVLKEKVFRNLTDEFYGAMQVLDELPSVQPETNCSEIPNNSDTISRQAVTKFLNDWLSCLFENCHKQSASDLKMIIKDFKNLPSAQSERTCVNCGRTANNGGWYADGRTRCPIEEHYALPKDGYCHLWEKRNITDDDYPERRPSIQPDTTTNDSNVVKKGGNGEDRTTDDLISRQQAIDAICEHGTDLERRGITVLAVANHKQATVDLLENLPSVQPEPRTAYWTKDIVGSVVCSYCGGIREDNRIGHTQWCNCCGCFMRGEEND